jgi:ribosomal protein S18 acetylase RimI-like enzyme
MDTGKIVIEEIKCENIETICKIAVDAWEQIHAGYRDYIANDDLYGRISIDWQKKKAESIRVKAQTEPENVLVAKDCNGQVMGFVTFSFNKISGIGEIGNNAVLPEFQGRGIGKQLYKDALNVLRERGAVYATVSTGYDDSGHAKARAAYEKAGFKKMKSSVTYSMKL